MDQLSYKVQMMGDTGQRLLFPSDNLSCSLYARGSQRRFAAYKICKLTYQRFKVTGTDL